MIPALKAITRISGEMGLILNPDKIRESEHGGIEIDLSQSEAREMERLLFEEEHIEVFRDEGVGGVTLSVFPV